jgi:peptidoglycan/xylan/chitin deacetylase (PgdA/CDA1 family)
MRLDRAITLNLVHPLRRAFVTRHASPVSSLPVLMYHSISDDPERGMRPYYRVCTGPQCFREQMQYLKDHGCRGVTLSEGLGWLAGKSREQKLQTQKQKTETCIVPNSQLSTFNYQPVVLTFDDGFHDFYTAARPVLQEFGFTATMYLPTAFIGNPRRSFSPSLCWGEGRSEVASSTINHQPSTGRPCLTWPEVRELSSTGMEFGSHTVSHPKLVECAWPKIESELRASKSEIENRLGVLCPAFAYPYAFPQGNQAFAPRFRDLVASVGYHNCVTTEIGRVKAGDNPYELKRLPVNSLDDTALFAAKLAGSYDWSAPLQAVVKRIKSAISGNRTPNHSVSNIAPVPAVK